MARMAGLSNVYNTVVKLRGMVGAEIHRLTMPDRRLIRMLRDMGAL